jgi:unsaturated chondroitin disaccharide hydrolase
MRNKIRLSFSLIVCVLLMNAGAMAQQKKKFVTDKRLLHTINQNFIDAGYQYQVLARGLSPNEFPKTYHAETGKLETSSSGWWCSGFYPGTLLLLYQQTHNTALLTEANRMLELLKKEQYNTTTHDLGFMMYCSFGSAQKIVPKPGYKEILINSAKALCSRFDPKVGCIKSWDSKKPEYIVIIDNMMNLELLFWATHATGDSTYAKVAIAHANTTMKNHFRADYSSYHVVVYNPQTGAVQEKRTAQGYANQSAWARGQAWGLYGYTLMYRETKDKKYLAQANHIANFLLNNPNLPKDKVPYWDFNAPNIPYALRDASAGAVIASALLELCRYTNEKDGHRYFSTAQAIIKNLSGKPYKAPLNTNGGFILQHSVGNIPENTEVDVPLTYADYYYIEAMIRYKNINKPRV